MCQISIDIIQVLSFVLTTVKMLNKLHGAKNLVQLKSIFLKKDFKTNRPLNLHEISLSKLSLS